MERGYGSVEDGARAQRPGVSRSRILPATAALAACAGAAVLMAGGASAPSSSAATRAVELQLQQLYSIPNFVYQRTQVHFPEAEENWLNMAAAGKIGDDVKPEKTLNKLNSIISEARTHGLTENYEARVKAKTLAMEENYDEYDVGKGKVKNKFYGDKQVGGSTTLKGSVKNAQLRTVPNQATQLADSTTTSAMVAAASRGATQVVHKMEGLRQQVASTLAAAPEAVEKSAEAVKAKAEEQMIAAESMLGDSLTPSSAGKGLLKVQVPAGLTAGQKFIANVGKGGMSMMVTVPQGVSGGQWVAISPPPAANTHPGAQDAVEAAIAAHTAPVQGGPEGAVDQSIEDHNESLVAQQKRVVGARKAEQLKGRMSQLRQVTSTRKGAGHPFASEMFGQSISEHYDTEPHTVFGLEK